MKARLETPFLDLDDSFLVTKLVCAAQSSCRFCPVMETGRFHKDWCCDIISKNPKKYLRESGYFIAEERS